MEGGIKEDTESQSFKIPVNQHPDAGLDERPDNVDGGDLQVEQLVLKNTVPKTQVNNSCSVHLTDSKSTKKTVRSIDHLLQTAHLSTPTSLARIAACTSRRLR